MKSLPVFVKCLISSLISAAIDLVLFYFINKACIFFNISIKTSIIIATVISRITSTAVNFIINKLWAFKTSAEAGKTVAETIKFFILFILKMAASAGLVAALSSLPLNTTLTKCLVDSVLFFISFLIQKFFIFKKEDESTL